MGLVRTIALVVLSISLAVFVALFGRLPIFRRTPIAFLYKLLWVYIPHGFVAVDERLTGRRVSRSLASTGNYLFNEAHPIILIFFVALQIIGEVLFIPSAWNKMTTAQWLPIPFLVVAPYTFLYLSSTTSSNIVPKNHRAAMTAYPYDFTLFHPGYFCHTCRHAKPARSKHCSLCKACIQRHDHHCIWINNCVGRNNYLWFVLLILSMVLLLGYASWLGHTLLDAVLQERVVPARLLRGSLSAKRWSTKTNWREWMHLWAWAISREWRIGAVMLLSFMSCPLAGGFLAYHTYLIWAGMTTNESSKWSDWKEDINDGVVWRAKLEVLREEFPPLPDEMEPKDSSIKWPGGRAKWWMARTKDGKRPSRNSAREGWGETEGGDGEAETEEDMRWEQVHSIAEVENLYDLGFWDNMVDTLFNRG